MQPLCILQAARLQAGLPPGTMPPRPQPDEYEKLGSYALVGLPEQLYPIK